jgi:hypothetical protein
VLFGHSSQKGAADSTPLKGWKNHERRNVDTTPVLTRAKAQYPDKPFFFEGTDKFLLRSHEIVYRALKRRKVSDAKKCSFLPVSRNLDLVDLQANGMNPMIEGTQTKHRLSCLTNSVYPPRCNAQRNHVTSCG